MAVIDLSTISKSSMVRRFLALPIVGLAQIAAAESVDGNPLRVNWLIPKVHSDSNVYLMEKTGDHDLDNAVQEAFLATEAHLAKEFPHESYKAFLQDFKVHLQTWKESDWFQGYKGVAGAPSCSAGDLPDQVKRNMSPSSVVAFPGGILSRIFGFDLGQLVMDLAQKASGPAAASGGLVGILLSQALLMGAGMLQSVIADAVHIIPPLIAPPLKPITCLPMITGINCFGAILQPVTAADFVIADVTDSMMNGYLAGFPATYSSKIGKTSAAKYYGCGVVYFGMMCASIFNACEVPSDSCDELVGGCKAVRMPMCFPLCLATLVACPGFWIDDILGPCMSVAVPPKCTMSVYWMFWRIPPQYVDHEAESAPSLDCPTSDPLNEFAADADATLYALDDAQSTTATGAGSAGGYASAGEGEGATTGAGIVRVPNAL